MTGEADGSTFGALLNGIGRALGLERAAPVTLTGTGALPSVYPVSDLAAASLAAAGLALA
jgi:hypothetical protein